MQTDKLLIEIADYVVDYEVTSELAYETARWCLMDSLGCGFLALEYPACVKLLGPVVPGAGMKGGARVPGTHFELDPVTAAFNISAMIRWLDYNDTWLAAEWGHPSDNLGAILACADYRARAMNVGLTVRDVLTAMIKAHEIQGILALENAFNRVGLDHVLLVRIASTAVATLLLGGTKSQTINALSNAWIDGGALRTYRHAPNTGSRKSWAAGDATARGVWHALMSLRGEMGYSTALSADKWGFQDVMMNGRPIEISRPFGSYVMENVLFKISYPAEFHAQTAIECAVTLHPKLKDRIDQIERVEITTQEAAVRIIDKQGSLKNPADRDHCLQYMVAIGLIFGRLTADDYEEDVACDPQIDLLRGKMTVNEDLNYSRDYLDQSKRSIANSVQVFFNDGTKTDRVEVEYPIGHRRRRAEGMPILKEKFERNLTRRFQVEQAQELIAVFSDRELLEETPIDALISKTTTKINELKS